VGDPLTFEKCEPIIAREVQRIGIVRGYDREDLTQEGWIAAARALPRVDPKVSSGIEFVRTSVRNAFIGLKRAAHTARRCPTSKTGRPLITGYDVYLDALPAREADAVLLSAPVLRPDEEASHLEATYRIRSMLGDERFEWLMAAAVDGADLATSKDLDDAGQMRLRFLANAAMVAVDFDYRVSKPKPVTKEADVKLYDRLPVETRPPQSELYSCHTDGDKPRGYDPTLVSHEQGADGKDHKVPICNVCWQKFSCLSRKLDTKAGPRMSLDVDREVLTVLDGSLTPDDARLRIVQRTALYMQDLPIPEDLAHDSPALGDEDEDDDVHLEPEPIEQPVAQATTLPAPPEEHPAAPAAEEEPAVLQAAPVSKLNGAAKHVAPKEAAPAAKLVSTKKNVNKQKALKPKVEVKAAAKPVAKASKKKAGKAAKPAVVAKAASKKAAKKAPKPAKVAKAKAPAAVRATKPKLKAKAAPPKAAKLARPPKAAAKAAPPKSAYNGPTVKTGEPAPMPTELTPARMKEKLASLKLGQPDDYVFRTNQVLVRRRRVQGDEVVVAFAPNGFELRLKGQQPLLFGSLSSCAIFAERRKCVSGNDFFHLTTHGNTELRDARGNVLLKKSLLTEDAL